MLNQTGVKLMDDIISNNSFNYILFIFVIDKMAKPLGYHPDTHKKNPIRIASMHNSHIAVECYNVEINDASPIHPDFFS